MEHSSLLDAVGAANEEMASQPAATQLPEMVMLSSKSFQRPFLAQKASPLIRAGGRFSASEVSTKQAQTSKAGASKTGNEVGKTLELLASRLVSALICIVFGMCIVLDSNHHIQ